MPSFHPRYFPRQLPLTPPESQLRYGYGANPFAPYVDNFAQPNLYSTVTVAAPPACSGGHSSFGRTAAFQHQNSVAQVGYRSAANVVTGANHGHAAGAMMGPYNVAEQAVGRFYDIKDIAATHSKMQAPPANAGSQFGPTGQPTAMPQGLSAALPPPSTLTTDTAPGNDTGADAAGEEKSVGGVSAKLDYDMETMTDFVCEMAKDFTNTGAQVQDAFRKWLSQLFCATRLPSATILLSLHYLTLRLSAAQSTLEPGRKPMNSSRSTSRPRARPSEEQLYRLLTIALLLGSKFLDDNTFINRSWSDVSGIPVAELNHLEVEWLVALDFSLHRNPIEISGFNTWQARWHQFELFSRMPLSATRAVDFDPLSSPAGRLSMGGDLYRGNSVSSNGSSNLSSPVGFPPLYQNLSPSGLYPAKFQSAQHQHQHQHQQQQYQQQHAQHRQRHQQQQHHYQQQQHRHQHHQQQSQQLPPPAYANKNTWAIPSSRESFPMATSGVANKNNTPAALPSLGYTPANFYGGSAVWSTPVDHFGRQPALGLTLQQQPRLPALPLPIPAGFSRLRPAPRQSIQSGWNHHDSYCDCACCQPHGSSFRPQPVVT